MELYHGSVDFSFFFIIHAWSTNYSQPKNDNNKLFIKKHKRANFSIEKQNSICEKM